MYDPQIPVVMKSVDQFLDKHSTKIWEFDLDWGIVQLNYPGYDKKVEQLLPYMRARFK